MALATRGWSGFRCDHNSRAARAQQIEPLERRTLCSAAALTAFAHINSHDKPHGDSHHEDMVLHWNNIAIDTLRHDSTLPGPTWASRSLAIVQVAVYNAVEAIDGRYEPIVVTHAPVQGASIDAAVASAAYHALVAIYPQQQAMLDDAYADSISMCGGGSVKKGVQLGAEVAAAVVAARSTDGANTVVTYAPDGQPGHWEPDPLNPGQTALSPNWGSVAPFSMLNGGQFRPPAPPALDSQAYADAFNEVKSFGAVDSAVRTADQTQIGHFWAYDRPGTGAPPSLYNQITQVIAKQKHNSEIDNARLFALVNVAEADAGCAAWDAKYVYNFWRPITAIRRAGEDNNAGTVADANWKPLGAPGDGVVPDFTPPFPAYISGHSTFGGAVFESIHNFYGTDNISFTISSDELPGVTRHFNKLSQAATENGQSRIYLGIHWQFDNMYGQQTGRAVADYVYSHSLLATGNQPHGNCAPDAGSIHIGPPAAIPYGGRSTVITSAGIEQFGTFIFVATIQSR